MVQLLHNTESQSENPQCHFGGETRCNLPICGHEPIIAADSSGMKGSPAANQPHSSPRGIASVRSKQRPSISLLRVLYRG